MRKKAWMPGVGAAAMMLALVSAGPLVHGVAARQPLQLDVYTADANSYNVTSTLIYGPTEAVLVDAQFRNSDATKLADRIARTGRHLKAIFITHPHPDHYIGTAVLLQRFPGTRIYMTAAGVDEFTRTAHADLSRLQASMKGEAPEALPTPEVLRTPHLTVDGQAVDIIADWQGDVLRPTNSWLWIPSLHAAIAGDLVFDRVHVWLPESTPETRAAWLGALDRLRARHPRVVVAGHRNGGTAADATDAVSFTHQYIADFDAARRVSSSASQLLEAMRRKYPDVALEGILTRGARAAFPN